MKSRQEIKSHVKNTFRNNWQKAILLTIIPIAISLVTNYSSYIHNINGLYGSSIVNLPFSTGLIAIIISIISSLLTIGATFQFIDWLKNKDLEFSPLKSSFRIFNGEDFWKIIGIMIINYFFTVLWTLLFIVPGIIKAYSYSQAFNLYKEAKENGTADQYNLVDYITQSKILMNGHKADFFVLDLSFIGWFLLSIVTLGLSSIWVTPYFTATRAEFFNELIKNK